jgi:hypothetical protein
MRSDHRRRWPLRLGTLKKYRLGVEDGHKMASRTVWMLYIFSPFLRPSTRPSSRLNKLNRPLDPSAPLIRNSQRPPPNLNHEHTPHRPARPSQPPRKYLLGRRTDLRRSVREQRAWDDLVRKRLHQVSVAPLACLGPGPACAGRRLGPRRVLRAVFWVFRPLMLRFLFLWGVECAEEDFIREQMTNPSCMG